MEVWPNGVALQIDVLAGSERGDGGRLDLRAAGVEVGQVPGAGKRASRTRRMRRGSARSDLGRERPAR
jgi:hypothetical protein